jgi:hypothetical protein
MQVLQEISTLVERLHKQIEDSRTDSLSLAKQVKITFFFLLFFFFFFPSPA